MMMNLVKITGITFSGREIFCRMNTGIEGDLRNPAAVSLYIFVPFKHRR